jgi:uncharacterized membrane protein (UPF0127 family)
VSSRAQVAVAATVAVLSLIGIAFVVHGWIRNGDARSSAPVGLRERDAVAPFTGYREVRIPLDDRCTRFVVADTEQRREDGLRGVNSLGPYTGMLFAQPRAGTIAFTMAGVTDPLEIAWYASDGTRVGTAHMQPCPDRPENCPEYRSPRAYRSAIEVPGGHPLPTQIAPC